MSERRRDSKKEREVDERPRKTERRVHIYTVGIDRNREGPGHIDIDIDRNKERDLDRET